MPDKGSPVSLIQNSFATGEVAPALYGRTDLAKYHTGCAWLRNFYVDYKGGVTVRPGGQYMGVPGSAGRVRLAPFQFSPNVGQTYMLVFSALKLRFIKNSGGNHYPNGSNAGFIQSVGVPYEITTPYAEADLPNLHYYEVADEMWITCAGHRRRKLSRISDTNWTLTTISTTPAIAAPAAPNSITITAAPSGSTDPGTTRYMYRVSAVNEDGVESFPSPPTISGAGINIAATLGTVSIFWSAVAGAVYYKVYKALPTSGDVVPNYSEQFGFAGYAYGTTFTDSNIVADFARGPLQDTDPFRAAGITGVTITNPGTGYPTITTLTAISDGAGAGAVVYPILSVNTAGGTGGITGIRIEHPGSGYVAPTIAASGGGSGFAATVQFGPATGVEPEVVGYVQQRLIYASSANKPNVIFAGRPGAQDDFRRSNPTTDADAYEFAISSSQVSDIMWLRSMPGGLVIGTNSGIVQLTGGSSNPANPAAITPTNAVLVPQSNYGAADLSPVVIDYDIIFVTSEGLVVDLQYNFFVNVYTGTDITIMSSHLFQDNRIYDWTYQDNPRKVIWGVCDDGRLLSMTFLKAQEIIGWAHHDTQGYYESIAVVQEGNEDAIYYSVQRFGAATRYIERMAGSLWYQRADAWQLDSALSTVPTFPGVVLSLVDAIGPNVLITAASAVFVPGDVGKILSGRSGRATVTQYVSPTQIRADIDLAFPVLDEVPFTGTNWRMDAKVGTVSGLTHLAGRQVYALADGALQGPFTVSAGGVVTLTTPAANVVVGLRFSSELQPLYIDVGGETTIQGRRKKVTAASIRVRNAAGFKYGTNFADMKPWRAGLSSTDPALDLPYGSTDLYTGDQRIVVDQAFTVGGWVCVRQDGGLPGTILAIIPEMAQGDTP